MFWPAPLRRLGGAVDRKSGGSAMLIAMLLAVVWAPLCASAHYSCRNHEELRGDGLWVVDCHGDVVNEVVALENGKFRYTSPIGEASEHQWSSRDRSMDSVGLDIPRCSDADTTAFARCLQVPPFFVWCANSTSGVAVYDTDFPRSFSAHEDFVANALTCGVVARHGPRYRAYNVRDVERAEEAKELAQNVTLGVILLALTCMFGCQKNRADYSRVK